MEGYLAQQLINGLAAGSLYALLAVGYSLVYGILELINFAHGDVYMFGTFIALALLNMNLPFPVAILLACVAGGIIGILVERIAYRPVRNAPRVVPMISAVGMALILRNVAQRVFGTATYPFPQPIEANVISVLGVRLPIQQPLIFVVGLALMFAFSYWADKTKLGKATRCVSQDIPASVLMGIPVNNIIMLVYAVGAFMGVASGCLFGMYYNCVFVGMGFLGTMKAWTAAILGGIGSTKGAFIGGILLGIMEALLAGFVSSAYKDAISFAILMAVLILRPTGLFGKQVAQKV
jgi:branched-chain amino acid transport system permease protein